MDAKVGDRIVVKGHSVGDLDRHAEILEVHGADGAPPYRVRWDDTGHETLFFPGSDAVVEHLGGPVSPTETVVEVLRREHARLTARLGLLLEAAESLDTSGDVVPDRVHEAYRFLEEEVVPHAAAEDREVYPVVGELLGSPAATAAAAREHAEVTRLVERLDRVRAASPLDDVLRDELRRVLYGLHALLRVNLSMEEDEYVQLLESRLSPKRGARLAQALELGEQAARGTVAIP